MVRGPLQKLHIKKFYDYNTVFYTFSSKFIYNISQRCNHQRIRGRCISIDRNDFLVPSRFILHAFYKTPALYRNRFASPESFYFNHEWICSDSSRHLARVPQSHLPHIELRLPKHRPFPECTGSRNAPAFTNPGTKSFRFHFHSWDGINGLFRTNGIVKIKDVAAVWCPRRAGRIWSSVGGEIGL